MKINTILFAILAFVNLSCLAQIEKTKIIDEGSSGPYKASAVTEKSLADFVVYRPQNFEQATKQEGKLPILVWANGGCMDSSINYERFLSEIASHGYLVVAIGTLQMTQEERQHKPTPDDKLLEAIDWITEQANSETSPYSNQVDIGKIAAAGHSCGGAQIMRIAGDPRIKTYMMFDSGMGAMTMAGANTESLKNLDTEVLYVEGGESDVAYQNALVDYDRINHVPIAFANLIEGGHQGTFDQKFGGSFSNMALDWLDWHFKGVDKSSVFLEKDLSNYPGWELKSKNFKQTITTDQKTITVTKDIPYRTGESDSWKLDLAMPENFDKGIKPALVIVHGGGWAAGSKNVDVYQKMMVDYALKGYVTINVEYRLTGEADFPACIEDVKNAVRWLRAHAEELNVDPERIGAYGHSAGAHLALMLGMTPDVESLEGDGSYPEFSSKVTAVAAGSPPTELGRDVPMAEAKWWPIGYIGSEHPPLFLIQGDSDRIVLPGRTKDFVDKMEAAGADIEYLEVEGGHGVAYAEKLEITEPAIEVFFAKYLNPDK